MSIRTRFAPSPTGFMHVGGARTALFAWLIARSEKDGVFVLRIEDTDKSREIEGSIDHIIEVLEWLGVEIDEGPKAGGEYGSYIQSERLDLYKDYAQKLIDKGLAYADPYTPDEVAKFRQQAQDNKQAFLFRNHRPDELITPNDWYGKVPLRFKVENIQDTTWQDEVRGELSAGEEALDDFIIMKADGYPTYNFAHVVDDHEMEITHVVRGEEFIASVPKFIALHQALEFDLPKFVTVPPILNKNGGKKLSKRDGAKDVLEYRKEGYLADGVNNFLATLGWNDGTEQEIFSLDELKDKFSVSRLQKSGAKFDDERLIWINGHHIRDMPIDDLYKEIDDKYWPEGAKEHDDKYKMAVLALVQDRLKYFDELDMLTHFFFTEPELSKELILSTKKLNEDDAPEFLKQSIETLEGCDFSEKDIENKLRALVEKLNTKPGILFSALRVSVTGQTVAPGLFETMHLLGKDKVMERLKTALSTLDT